jgi:hypothetical protein
MADFYTIVLRAGVDHQQSVSGKLILVDDIGAADGIDITPMLNGGNGRTMPKRKKAFKCWTDYDAVVLRSEVDTTVSLFLASKDVSLGFADGALVNVVGEVSVGNDPSARIPVEIGGSTVQVTADNVGINNTDANAIPVAQKAGASFTVEQKAGVEFKVRDYLAAVVTDAEPVQVSDVAKAIIAASGPRRGLRVKNVGAAAVAIGGAGVKFAAAVVSIQPGEVWNENEAPGAAWYCVTDAGLASQINIQTIA